MAQLMVESQFDAACFRLSRLRELVREAGADYRGRSDLALATVEGRLKCTFGRERFNEGVDRHREWLRSLGYEQYLETGDWAVVRYFALRSAGYVCATCDAGRGLEVHHLTYERRCVESLDDVIVLCARCHRRAHDLPSPRRARHGGLNRLDPFAAVERFEKELVG